MAENTQLIRPSAGEHPVLSVGPDAKLEFAFNQGDADLSKDGQNLVFTFDDGATLTLEGFYDNFGEGAQPPTLVVEGQEFPGEEFLAALNNPDLMPAAGPAAGPALGGGTYADAALAGVGGVDRLDKLEFDGWDRDVSVEEQRQGIGEDAEIPGGSFALSAGTDVGGAFRSAVFEDARPNQHLGDDTQAFGRIEFSFTPTGTTQVTGVHLSGFDAGTRLFVGEPVPDGAGGYTNAIVVSGPSQFVNFTQADFTSDGVYIMPPKDSDHDMDINAVVDLRAASSGLTGTATGGFTIVVDAVADKPEVDSAALGDTVYHDAMAVEDAGSRRFEDGWAKEHAAKTDATDAADLSYSAEFTANVTFGDYTDGSERHYVMVEVPGAANLAAGVLPAGWSISEPTLSAGNLAAGLEISGRIILWYDAEGKVVGEGATPPADFDQDGGSSREFYQISVPNEVLQENGGACEVKVEFEFSGLGPNDVAFDLHSGAKAEEEKLTDRDLVLDNNVSYEGNLSGDVTDGRLSVDTVDAELNLRAGWVSEGNAPDKNLAGGTQGHEWTEQSHENETDGNLRPDAASTGDGAPLTLSVTTGGMLPDGSPAGEHITGASFSFDADGAILRSGATELVDGTHAVGGVTYTVSTDGGVTTVSISGLPSGATDLDALNLNFLKSDRYSDADINFTYTVDVESSVGAKAHFSGSSTVAVDAVADISGDVGATVGDDASGYGSEFTALDPSDGSKTLVSDSAEHGPDGWETDTFGRDYSDATFNLAVGVTTTFNDTDGSENHYILVEKPDGNWSLGGLPGGYAFTEEYQASDGKTYFKIEVPADAAAVDVKIPLTYTNVSADGDVSYDIRTGSYVEERTDPASGREYDLRNNTAERLGETVVYKADVIDSELTVQTGWASEGNNDAKHLGASSDAYATQTQYADSTANEGAATNLGAPIVFGLAGGGSGSGESISSVTFTFDDARGSLWIGNAEYHSGDVIPVNAASLDNLVFRPAHDAADGPQSYNDADVEMGYTVTVENAAGASHTFTGTSTVIVDAVADRSGDVSAAVSDAPADPSGGASLTGVDSAEHGPDGWETDTFGRDYSDATFNLAVDVTTTFNDTDGSENHYILVEKPDGNWSLGELPGGYVFTEEYQASDGETYFKIEVPADAAVVDVKIPLTYASGSAGGDVSYDIRTGSYVEEKTDPASGREYDLRNNTAERLGETVVYKVDVINSELTVKTGWASEGNNDAKHMGAHEQSGSSLYETPADLAGSTANAALSPATNLGAPITFALDGSQSGESISSVTLTFEGARGDIMIGDAVLSATPPDGQGMVTVTISGAELAAGGVVFRPAHDAAGGPQSYNDADVEMGYAVTVENTAGASYTFEGTSTVIVDAVADRSGAVSADIGGQDALRETVVDDGVHAPGDVSAKIADADLHDARGWESDTFSLDYSDVAVGFSLHVETTFSDTDGSENHYILVEKPDGNWTIGDLSGTGLSWTEGDYYTSGGTTYFTVKVDALDPATGLQLGDVKIDVPLSYSGTVSGDVSASFKTGAYVVEKGESAGNAEFDLKNNEAARTGEDQVSYSLDVINSTLTVKTGWASEGANDSKHLASGAHNAASSSDTAARGYADSTSDGSAKITLSLGGAAGAGEKIASVTFSFDDARGSLWIGGKEYHSGDAIPVNAASLGNLIFKPAVSGDASFDYSDVGMQYDVTVVNNAGASWTFNGTSVVAVDAVADRPGVSIKGDGSQVDYPDMTDPKTDQTVEQTAAKPGDEVTVRGTVSFPDVSGGENHFILIERPSGTYPNDYTLDSFEISFGSGADKHTLHGEPASDGTWTLTLDGATVDEGVTLPQVEGGGFYKVDAGYFDGGDTIPAFDVSIDITVDRSASGYLSVDMGGRAEVAETGERGGAESSDYEFDTANNVSTTTAHVTVAVAAVDTASVGMSVGSAYENADRDAHQGFVARADMLMPADETHFKAEYLGAVKADSAEITFTAPSSGEAIYGLSVRFEPLPGHEADTGNFMYKDTLIPTDTSALPGGHIEVGGDKVYCGFENGHVTMTIVPADGAYETTGQNLYFVPGESFSHEDIPLEYAAVVRDGASGYTKAFDSSAGDVMTADLAGKLGIDRADPNQMDATQGTTPPVGDYLVEVDAVAQRAGFETEVEGLSGYDHIVPGGTATVHMHVDLRDTDDASETHSVYVQAVPDFEPAGAIEIRSADGELLAAIPVESGDLQNFGPTTYFSYTLPDGLPPNVIVDVKLLTPGDAAGKQTVKVGVLTQEEILKITAGNDDEFTTANNQAQAWGDVSINFSSCGVPAIGVAEAYFENGAPRAHVGDGTLDATYAVDANPDISVPFAFSFGDGNDTLEAFSLALKAGSEELGELCLFTTQQAYQDYLAAVNGGTDAYTAMQNAVDAGVVIRGDALVVGQNGVTAEAVAGGKVVFLPEKESHSGEDPRFDYTVTVKDGLSGQTHTITSDDPGRGALTITADSVAQQPSDLGIEGSVDGILHQDVAFGGTITAPITAAFADMDETTEHYILVEARAGWTVKADGTTYSEIVVLEEGGKSYYKIPVTPEVSAGDPNTGTATADVSLTAPNTFRGIFRGPYAIDVKAGSTDEAEGGELIFHNNTAVIGGAGLEGNVHGGSGGGSGDDWDENGGGTWTPDPGHGGGGIVGSFTFEQTGPLYEDNQPYQNLSDAMAPGGDAAREVGGQIRLAAPDGYDACVITVPVDGNGEPLLIISGSGVSSYDAVGHVYTVDLGINNGAGIDVKVGPGAADSDADLRFGNVTFTGDGKADVTAPGGGVTVLVDAAADRGEVHAKVDPVTGGDDAAHILTDGVAGTEGADGADSAAVIKVEATFGDTDGSERHYVLVEKTPDWAPAGGGYAVGEAHIDGTTYYRFDVTADANSGKAVFDIGMVYQGTGAADADGVVRSPLQVGSMSQEAHLSGGEYDLGNNTAVNLEGNVVLQYSPLDSVGGMSFSRTVLDEGAGESVQIGITGIATDKHDVLGSLTVTYSGQGTLTLGGEVIPNGFGGFSLEQLAGLSDGSLKFAFTPDASTHEDVSFSWSGTVKDAISGASTTVSGSRTLVIDAVAGGSEVTVAAEYAGGLEAALSAAPVDVLVTADFRDNVNASEEHWVVLEQRLGFETTGAKYSTDGGATWTEVPVSGIVTRFDDGGNPYFAVKIPDQTADAQVKFTVKTPASSADIDYTLQAGTIVTDTTMNSAGNREPDYSDNWVFNSRPVTIDTAVVTSTTVKVTPAQANMLEDGAPVQLHFSVPDSAATHDTIQNVTIKVPANAVIIVNGTEYASGNVVINSADLDEVYFKPGADWSGNFKLDITAATLVDEASGAIRAASVLTDGTISVTGVVDAPTAVAGQAGTAEGVNNSVTFNVSAAFTDINGGEAHYILVQVPAGWSITSPATSGLATVEGEQYAKIPVSNALANPSVNVTMSVAQPLGESGATVKVGAQSVESGVIESIVADAPVALHLTNSANLVLADNNPVAGVAEGGNMSFTLKLVGTDGKPYTPGEEISVTVRVSGAGLDPADLDGGDLKLTNWTDNGDGTYDLTLALPANQPSVNLSIPVVSDAQLEGAEGVRVEIVDADLGNKGGYVINAASVVGQGFNVAVTDSAKLVLEQLNPDAVEGESLGFSLNLQKNSGDPLQLGATEAITVSFLVTGFDPESNAATDLLPGIFASGTDTHGNVINWTYNAANHSYTVTATLASGEAGLEINAAAALSRNAAGVIDAAEGLRFELSGMETNGLNCTLVSDNGPLAPGATLDFTLTDAEYNDVATQLGQEVPELIGMDVNAVELGTSDADTLQGGAGDDVIHGGAGNDTILGGAGDDTIYGGTGNDTLIGGSGADAFVWTTGEMGGTDVVKDFNAAQGDTLRFDDLFGGGEQGQASLEALLNVSNSANHVWMAGGQAGQGTFTAHSADGTAIQLTLGEAAATLKISYTTGEGTESVLHTQQVMLENFHAPDLTAGQEAQELSQMLNNIIKVTE
jgi:hypothetical protein